MGNFEMNRKHFIEGEDFYVLDSNGLHEFRASVLTVARQAGLVGH